METDTDLALAEQAEARRDIRALFARYARGVDARDEALLASCYHDDARHNHGRFLGDRHAFARWTVHQALAGYGLTLHAFQQSTIVFTGRDSATCETYASALHRNDQHPAGSVDEIVVARYCDRVERRSGGPWLFRSRTTVYQWTRIDLVDGAGGSLEGTR